MQKDILFKLGKSLIITLSISFIFSFFIGSIFQNLFLPSFILFTALQFIGFYFYGENKKQQNLKVMLDNEKAMAELNSYQQARVICPCDRQVITDVNLRFDEKNSYMCQGCNKKVNIILETKTVLDTTPIDSPLLEEHVKKLLESKTNGN